MRPVRATGKPVASGGEKLIHGWMRFFFYYGVMFAVRLQQ
jgi:hypothetical protein